MAKRRVVVLGGAISGPTAAARARETDEDADIVILERSGEVSYAACALAYHASGEVIARARVRHRRDRAHAEQHGDPAVRAQARLAGDRLGAGGFLAPPLLGAFVINAVAAQELVRSKQSRPGRLERSGAPWRYEPWSPGRYAVRMTFPDAGAGPERRPGTSEVHFQLGTPSQIGGMDTIWETRVTIPPPH